MRLPPGIKIQQQPKKIENNVTKPKPVATNSVTIKHEKTDNPNIPAHLRDSLTISAAGSGQIISNPQQRPAPQQAVVQKQTPAPMQLKMENCTNANSPLPHAQTGNQPPSVQPALGRPQFSTQYPQQK